MYPSTGIPKRRSSPVDPTNEIVIMLPCDHQNTLEPCFDQISITIKSPSSQQTKKEKSAKSTYCSCALERLCGKLAEMLVQGHLIC